MLKFFEKVTTFQTIQKTLAPELKRLNDLISATLTSPNALMNKVVSTYLEKKGKMCIRDRIMPLVTLVTGGVNFTDKKIILRHMTDGNGDVITQQVADQLTAAGQTVNPEVYLTWGVFVQSIVDFLIIAFCIFVAIRFMNKLKKSTKEEEAAPAEPTKEEALLTEIRDLLKAQADNKK